MSVATDLSESSKRRSYSSDIVRNLSARLERDYLRVIIYILKESGISKDFRLSNPLNGFGGEKTQRGERQILYLLDGLVLVVNDSQCST